MPATSVVQITHFQASEANMHGSVSLKHILTQVGKPIGLKESYLGYQSEDTYTQFWVNYWASKDACDALVKAPCFDNMRDACLPAFASPPTVKYVEVANAAAAAALYAPTTEIVTLSLKAGRTMGELERLVWALRTGFQGTAGLYVDSWGPAMGKTDVYCGVLGWEDEANWVSSRSLKGVVDKVKLVADMQVANVMLDDI